MRTLKKEEGESLVIVPPMDTEVMKKFFFPSKSVSNFLQLAAVR